MTTTVLDRFVRWNLDLDGGDLYGDDERERLRWYEGIATASQVQSIAVPWVAAIAVWVAASRAVAVVLVLVLAAFLVPALFTALYVRSRRVETTPRTWSAKRVALSFATGLPTVIFLIGVMRYAFHDSTAWQGSIVGAVIGGLLGIGGTYLKTRQRRRAEAEAALAGDED